MKNIQAITQFIANKIQPNMDEADILMLQETFEMILKTNNIQIESNEISSITQKFILDPSNIEKEIMKIV